MAVSELRLVRRYVEYLRLDEIHRIPPLARGIYVLFKYRPKLGKYDVVYIGMTAGSQKGSIKGRLRSHRRKKKGLWTHFSAFEVWDNIREEEVRELEGILRHIFRKDSHANKLGIQKSFKKLTKIRRETQKENWIK